MTDNDLATSEGDETFSPEEQAAFDAYERGEDGPAAAPAAVEAPEGAAAGGEAAAAAAAAPEAAPGEVVEPDLDGDDDPTKNKGAFVRHGAFHQARERYKAEKAARVALEGEMAQLRERFTRGDERLRLLTEAARAQPATPAPAAVEPPKVIDPKEDIFGAYEQLKAELAELKGGVQQETARQRQEREYTEVTNAYRADLDRFAAVEPTFADAFRFVAQTRAAELTALGVPEAQIRQELGKEEMNIALAARQRGVSPAELLFQVAKARGFTPKAAEPTPPPAPVETAAQKAERVAAGQAGPGKSLSAAGGAPAGEVTLEMLGSMSEADFEAFALKNPRKLARLMGEEA